MIFCRVGYNSKSIVFVGSLGPAKLEKLPWLVIILSIMLLKMPPYAIKNASVGSMLSYFNTLNAVGRQLFCLVWQGYYKYQ